MRGKSVLFSLMRSGQLGTLDDLAAASLAVRQVEATVRGVGHVLVSVDPAGTAGAYQATITTDVGTAQLSFDPGSPASQLLHSAGVTQIPAKKPVSKYIPLGIAIELAHLADGRAA